MDIMQLLNTDTLWNPQKNLRIYVKEQVSRNNLENHDITKNINQE